MATVLQPIVNELNTVLVQLRTELRGLQTDADGSGIAIVRCQGTTWRALQWSTGQASGWVSGFAVGLYSQDGFTESSAFGP